MATAETVRLKSLLDERGITLYQFCQDIGLSYQQGSAIASNKTKKIEFQTIEKICNYLACDVSQLINIKPKIRESGLKTIVLNFPLTGHAKRESSTDEDGDAKPFLQWVGGKRSMISQYKDFFPKRFNRYIEPFLGGGAIFFHLRAESAIVNDSNPELVYAYEAVRDNPADVVEMLALLKARHSLELYQAIRNLDRDPERFLKFKKAEIAARMIYLNQTCFNGVYRVNKHGQFNVPIGSSLNRLICDGQTIFKASEALQKAEIFCTDFNKILEEGERGDFVYLDPPYFPISQYSDFTRYTKEKFHQEDQIRLKEAVDGLDKRGSKVMLSNSNSDFIKDLYKDYKIHTVYSGRTLNVHVNKRGRVPELVITNY